MKMRKAVDFLTVIALLAILVGGSMLDSPNLAVPVAFIAPGTIWIGIRAVVTEVCK